MSLSLARPALRNATAKFTVPRRFVHIDNKVGNVIILHSELAMRTELKIVAEHAIRLLEERAFCLQAGVIPGHWILYPIRHGSLSTVGLFNVEKTCTDLCLGRGTVHNDYFLLYIWDQIPPCVVYIIPVK